MSAGWSRVTWIRLASGRVASLAGGRRLGAALLSCLLLLVMPWGRRAATGGEPKDDPLLLPRHVAPRASASTRFAGWALKGDAEEGQVAEAIARGCAWLVAHQEEDGSFLGEAAAEFRVGLSALAVLAFLDAGHIPDDATSEGAALRNGIAFLLASQDEEGCVGRRLGERYIYGHAYGSYALVRAYEVTGGVALGRAVQAALDFTGLARNPYFGWRYGIRAGDNDTDVTGSMMLAVAEAEAINARAADGEAYVFRLDPGAWAGVRAWLDKVTDLVTGRVGYLARGSGPARYDEQQMEWFPEYKSESITAVGAWCQMRRGEDPNKHPLLQEGLERIAKLPPEWNTLRGGLDQYFWMWTGRAAHELDRWGGKMASKLDRWRGRAVAALLSAQEGGTNAFTDAGSWPPDGAWGRWGGRVYSTALAVSTLKLSGYRGVLRSEGGAAERVEQISDRGADLDARLASIESVPAGASKKVVQALVSLLRDPVPLVRLAAAEALARLGPAAADTASRVAKQVGVEKQVEIRHALLFALLRMAKSSKSIVETLTRAAVDPDPGVRALAKLAHEAVVSVEPPASVQTLGRLRSAAEVVAVLESRGQLGLEGVPARIAAVRWRLLREVGLPHHLGARVGQRIALLPTSALEAASILEAVEKALASLTTEDELQPESRSLYDAAVSAIEARAGAPGDRARLAAALELHVARAYVGVAKPDTAGVLARLDRHRKALLELAPTLDELDGDACRAVALRCRAAIEAVTPRGDAAETVSRLADALEEHGAQARAFHAYPELVRWVNLAHARLLASLADVSQREAALALARDRALDVMAGPVDTSSGRRVAIYGAESASLLAPFVGVSRTASPLARELPATPVQDATSSEGLRVELMDVAFQQLPLLAPNDVRRLGAREQLVVRVRTTPTQAPVTWDERVGPLWVRARRGVAPDQVHLLPWAPEQTPLAVDVEALGGSPRPEGSVAVGQSVVTIHVFGVTESELAEGLEISVGIRSGAAEGYEPLVRIDAPASSILRSVAWTTLVAATKGELLQRIPDVEASPEGVSLLVTWALLEGRGGPRDVARATFARALGAAEALGDAATVARVKRLLDELESK